MHCSAPYAKRKGCLSMADLRDLYQEVILDHTRRPRNFGRLAGANRCAEGFNPLCGDKVTLYLKLVEVQVLFGAVHALLTSGDGADPAASLGKLEVLSGVREFPVRVKCATLPWHTLQAALRDEARPVSTE